MWGLADRFRRLPVEQSRRVQLPYLHPKLARSFNGKTQAFGPWFECSTHSLAAIFIGE